MILSGGCAKVIDVMGAFLHGRFQEGEEIFMEVPEGWKDKYPSDAVLRLLKTLYGLRQAAIAFWKELLKCMCSMDMNRSKADPCLYFKWNAIGLVIIASWVDDNMCLGDEKNVDLVTGELMERFDCEDCGEFDELLGCKITRLDNGGLKFTQEVLLQSFKDEFDLPEQMSMTPAVAGNILTKGDTGLAVSPKEQTKYRSGIGKMIHMMAWSRPDICNAVRDAARHMQSANSFHVKAMHKIMSYCTRTPHRGITLNPVGKWDGKKGYKFKIGGRSDSDYATDPESRRSVSGTRVSVNEAPVMWRATTQKGVTLSVTEAESAAAVTCAQDMMYAKHIIESLELDVELPMVLEIDNQGAVDLINSWIVGGRTRHTAVRLNYLRELKEQGVMVFRWISGDENDADMHTKNVPGPLLEKHCRVYFGEDEYYYGKGEHS